MSPGGNSGSEACGVPRRCHRGPESKGLWEWVQQESSLCRSFEVLE